MATMAQAKRDFSLGYLRSWEVKRGSSSSCSLLGRKSGVWCIWLGEGNGASWLEETREREPRQFITLDAAIGALEQIGFKVEGFASGKRG